MIAHAHQFSENIVKGSIHCLSPTELNIIHCLCDALQGIFFLNKFLVGDNDRILFAIHGDRNGVVSGYTGCFSHLWQDNTCFLCTHIMTTFVKLGGFACKRDTNEKGFAMNIAVALTASSPRNTIPAKTSSPAILPYEKIRRSLHDFGYVDPVIWNEVTGNIVGGHQRYKVLVSEGATEIDCVVVHIEDPQDEKALNIALEQSRR